MPAEQAQGRATRRRATLLRAIPGLTFKDVDHVTQWSYCSGGGGGLPIEKPEITPGDQPAPTSRGRRQLEVDALISACPWSERPLSEAAEQHRGARPVRAARRNPRASRSERPHARRGAGGAAMTVTIKSAVDDAVIDELRAIYRDDGRVLPGLSSRVNRTRVPAPFPVHRWAEHMPDVDGAAAYRARGLRDGQARQPATGPDSPARRRDRAQRRRGPHAQPRRHPRRPASFMNQIHEIDLVDRTVTVGPGINMLKLNEELRRTASSIPTIPPRTRARWSAGGSGRAAGRCSARASVTPATSVISMEVVLPTGEIVRDRRRRRAQAAQVARRAWTLKQLFTGHQGTLGDHHARRRSSWCRARRSSSPPSSPSRTT